MEDHANIIVVSGLPRSGTSMMMQALKTGGVEVLCDGERQADEDNPAGYLEAEAIKALSQGNSAGLVNAEGKAVKVIHALLRFLPASYRYKVIFMVRDLEEVVASQRKMLERRGRSGAALSDTRLMDVFAKQRNDSLAWATNQSNIEIIEVEYHRCIREPIQAMNEVASFVGNGLNGDVMAESVCPELHRQKRLA